jgi:LmbE family N-acetylglucosaminyl deacetylase
VSRPRPSPFGTARRVTIVSPHLDDAALSLGATIARATAGGVEVDVVTVLAGDPASRDPAGRWDARCGFDSAADAAVRRRREDARACALLGARPLWLPFADEQYSMPDPGAVADALAAAASEAEVVLVPGWPLTHDDHAWLARLAWTHLDHERLGFYLEQPYGVDVALGRGYSHRPLIAAAATAGRTAAGRRPAVPFPAEGPAQTIRVRPTTGEWRRKRQALACYASQLRGLGRHVVTRIRVHELAAGGEALALPAPGRLAAEAPPLAGRLS